MKIAVLGGTFNPLHNGHVMIARNVCEILGYDRILFVPAFLPPHKISGSKETAEDRLGMVQALCDSEESGCFICESCEIDRGGISYTCDTLEFLTEKYKEQLTGKLAFILGEESAAEFHKWKNPDRIAEIADLIIACRKPGTVSGTLSANRPAGQFKGDFSVDFDSKHFAYPFIRLQNPEMKVSSSEIREDIASGNKEWLKKVPETVARYIEEHKLYGVK